MSKLDSIKPTHESGLYKVEVQVEGQWLSLALVSKETIISLTDYLDYLSDKDTEATL